MKLEELLAAVTTIRLCPACCIVANDRGGHRWWCDARHPEVDQQMDRRALWITFQQTASFPEEVHWEVVLRANIRPAGTIHVGLRFLGMGQDTTVQFFAREVSPEHAAFLQQELATNQQFWQDLAALPVRRWMVFDVPLTKAKGP